MKTLKKANPYGCGSHTCYGCYPYTYGCDFCGAWFSEPVENPSEYECESCGWVVNDKTEY